MSTAKEATHRANPADFADEVRFDDHKIAFALRYATGKRTLDIGCVMHDPENYRSKYWLHRALAAVSSELVGIDSYREGVNFLTERGYNVLVADAQDFDLGRQFDVIVAGDIIEHLANLAGFLESCKRHMAADGRLIISTPNPWYWRHVVHAALGRVRVNPEHTCWFCPETLRQLVERQGLAVATVEFGSRYLRDRLMPLPPALKHTSFNAEIRFAR
jgi:2-polyprenyl-3-methyl-5-hydroxy-6-metoxy-1,4-benzoquinol methylase